MTRKSLPKYVYNDRGYLRFIRRSRGISVMMHEEAGTPEFWDHYNRLLKGKPAPAPVKRNFEALIISYYESDAYKKLKPRTRSDYRRYISHIREIWADKDPARIETHHIYELHRANADHWRQANYLVQVMVVLMNHARLIGFIKKEHGNPAKGIPLFKQQSDGWEPWPDDVRAEFEALASKRARLVYELCVGTGQRIGDVVKMKWEHFSDEGFDFTQGKTDKPLVDPAHRPLESPSRRARTNGRHCCDRREGSTSELPYRCRGNACHQKEDEAREGELLQNARAQEKCDDRAVSGWM